MAKKESNFITMVVSLFLVTLIASSALAFVYEMTKGPIAEAKRIKKANAIREVVPDLIMIRAQKCGSRPRTGIPSITIWP